MISVVIRNKNESVLLNRTLSFLFKLFRDDIDEVIIVDNLSTDNSKEVASNYGCKVVDIVDFTYGRAINLGIQSARNNNILLLSSHAMPVSSGFFKNTLSFIKDHKDWAGIRYVNSVQNLERLVSNNYEVKEPYQYGLMAACCLVSKKVWETIPFNEELSFSEDKEWSERVIKNGYKIYDFNESFFYDIKRSDSSELNRIKNETLAQYQLNKQLVFPSKIKLIASFVYGILVLNPIAFLKKTKKDFLLLRVHLWLSNQLK